MQYRTTPRNGDKDLVLKCRVNRTLPLGPGTVSALLAIRKEAAMHREQMLNFQKECGAAKDRDGAKFFKQEAAEAMKVYRAACLLVPYFTSDHPGDCKHIYEWDWPPDLFGYLDRVMAMAEYSEANLNGFH